MFASLTAPFFRAPPGGRVQRHDRSGGRTSTGHLDDHRGTTAGSSGRARPGDPAAEPGKQGTDH